MADELHFDASGLVELERRDERDAPRRQVDVLDRRIGLVLVDLHAVQDHHPSLRVGQPRPVVGQERQYVRLYGRGRPQRPG